MSEKIKRLEARFCGVGGQGIVLGSTILADAAIFYEGKYAVQSPTYGSQVRGGPTKVDLVVDDKEILYPKATRINFFLAIAQISFTKYFYDIADNCTILIDENLVVDTPEDMIQGTQRTLYRIPVMEMAKSEFNNNMLANMICLGVTQEVTQVVSKENLLMSVKKLVPSKHYEKNVLALEMGIELARNRQREQISVG
jgi:2-oxoglutarate ferredoxin oxidoreductase subunit gamma